MQNPLNNYCETAVNWLHIHSNKPHELETLTNNQQIMLTVIQATYRALHNTHGERLSEI